MTDLSLKKKKKIANESYTILKDIYGKQEMTLNFSNAWELLVGGILGAQTTDEQVNRVTAVLFEKYPNIEDIANLTLEEAIEEIKTIGLYRNKAKALIGSAKKILNEFDGKVPQDRDELMSLPGVGPKVANLVRGDFFKIPAIVVDTHCGRISRLLGLSKSKNPTVIEKDLVEILPEETWIDWGHFLVLHGRNYCKARCRNCLACPLNKTCQYALSKEVQIKIEEAKYEQLENGCF